MTVSVMHSREGAVREVGAEGADDAGPEHLTVAARQKAVAVARVGHVEGLAWLHPGRRLHGAHYKTDNKHNLVLLKCQE